MDVLISSILLAILAPDFGPFGRAKKINTQSSIFLHIFFYGIQIFFELPQHKNV